MCVFVGSSINSTLLDDFVSNKKPVGHQQKTQEKTDSNKWIVESPRIGLQQKYPKSVD